MNFKIPCRTLLITYLVGSLCLPRAWAVDTSSNLNLQNQIGSPPASTEVPLPLADGSTSFAQGFNGPANVERGRPGSFGMVGGQEYVSGNYPGAVLIPVTILGPVSKQGIHHIPTKTNLIKFLSLAGGVSSKVEWDDVIIKRVSTKNKFPTETNGEQRYTEEVLHVNVDELISNPGSRGPVLQQDDLVILKENTPIFSGNTILAIGLLSSILGIVVSAIVINNEIKK